MKSAGVLVWLVGVVAACMSAASAQSQPRFLPEPRSGMWGARAVVDGRERVLLLTLEVTRRTDQEGTAGLTFYGRVFEPRAPSVVLCAIDVTVAAPGDPSDLSAVCRGSTPGDGNRLALHFGQEGQEVAATWWSQGKPMKLHFERPSQDSTTRFEGDWVTDRRYSPQCVLHVYRNEYDPYPPEFEDLNPEHITSTLDWYAIDGSEGYYGKRASFGPHGSSVDKLSFSDDPTNYVDVVTLDAQTQRLVFVPPANSRCRTFTRVQGSESR